MEADRQSTIEVSEKSAHSPDGRPILILGLSGSLRSASHNTALLRAAAQLMPEGTELTISGQLGKLPLFNEDLEADIPPAVAELRDAVIRTDGLLVATPEYNSSIPGPLKNAIDWLSRPFETAALRNKPTLVIGASTGMFGAVWSQAETRKTIAAAGARVLDLELPVPTAHEQFHENGDLLDQDLMQQLAGALQALVAAVVLRREAANA